MSSQAEPEPSDQNSDRISKGSPVLDSEGCAGREAKAHQPVAVRFRYAVETLHYGRVTCLKLVKLHMAHMGAGT